MCLTDKFDPDDDRHRTIKQGLMRHVALRDIATTGEVDRSLEAAGFHVIEGTDRNVKEGPSTPWYQPMENQRGTLRGVSYRAPWGRKAIFAILKLTEALRLFPEGSAEICRFLDQTAAAYVPGGVGGRSGVFTPLYCFLARKPL